ARGIRRVNNTAGPADFFALVPFRVLLKAAGNFQTRGVYAPLRGTRTVKIPLSASFPVLNKCQWEIQ
ncbi:MAG: hypothetical protein SCH71_15585, partial [Desulfobulbaceae bacterium]|nr:hypothetical protein [Desulfobulbaceae bacterium]